jgi:hypothetical protein
MDQTHRDSLPRSGAGTGRLFFTFRPVQERDKLCPFKYPEFTSPPQSLGAAFSFAHIGYPQACAPHLSCATIKNGLQEPCRK